MSKIKIIAFLGGIFFCICCSNLQQDSSAQNNINGATLCNFHYLLDSLKNQLLGDKIAKIKRFKCHQGVFIRDTIMESEGVEWPAIAFYENENLLFIAESNWEDTTEIKRITIFSNKFKSNCGIKIGSTFREIETNLSRNIPSYPDGYFGLKDKKDNGITYFFDIDNFEQLYYGATKWEDIPLSITVETIIIEK